MTHNLKATLAQGLKELHLPTIRDCYENIAQKAQSESLTYEQFLLELTEQELLVRRHNKIQRLLKESSLPLEKSLDSFDLKRLPQKIAAIQAQAKHTSSALFARI